MYYFIRLVDVINAIEIKALIRVICKKTNRPGPAFSDALSTSFVKVFSERWLEVLVDVTSLRLMVS